MVNDIKNDFFEDIKPAFVVFNHKTTVVKQGILNKQEIKLIIHLNIFTIAGTNDLLMKVFVILFFSAYRKFRPQ